MLSSLVQNFAASCSTSFLGLKPWYAYLKLNPAPDCSIKSFNLLPKGRTPSDVPLVFLAVIDDLMRLAGLVAVVFVIYGGVQYVTSQGNPEDASRAQSTIQNALIGLAVAIIAVLAVSFLGTRLSR